MTWNLDTFANAMVLECGDKEQSHGKNEDEMELDLCRGLLGEVPIPWFYIPCIVIA